MKKIVILITLIVSITGCQSNVSSYRKNAKLISSKVAKEMYDEGNTFIIDVRTNDEYMESHIKEAINIPLNNIEEINNIVQSKDSNIIVYCQSGNRSNMAKIEIQKLGYKNVYDLGSINNWTYSIAP